MATYTINLKLGTDGKLLDPDIVEITDDDIVVLQIAPGEAIQSFHIKGKLLAHHHPFTANPSSQFRSMHRFVVRKKQSKYDWDYAIIYKLTGSSEKYELDPKMKIKPKPGPGPNWKIALVIAAAVITGLFIRNAYISIKKAAEK